MVANMRIVVLNKIGRKTNYEIDILSMNFDLSISFVLFSNSTSTNLRLVPSDHVLEHFRD